MHPTEATSRRTLTIAGVATVVVLVAGLAAVVVVSAGDDGGSVEAGGSTTTTMVTADAAVAPEEAGGGSDAGPNPPAGGTGSRSVEANGSGGATAASDSSGGGTAAESGATAGNADLGAPQDPGPAVPPRAGAYKFTVTNESGAQEEATIKIEDKGESAGERRQTMTMGGAEGSGTFDVAWRADGQYMTKMVFSFGADGAECDWEPDIRSLAAPLAKGATWSYASSCTVTFRGTPYKLDRKGTFEVVDLVRERVAGQVLDLWKIKSNEETSFGAAGGSKEETTALFSPKHGLQVKSTRSVAGSGPRGSRSGTRTTEIKSLDPA